MNLKEIRAKLFVLEEIVSSCIKVMDINTVCLLHKDEEDIKAIESKLDSVFKSLLILKEKINYRKENEI